jgi:hypothetical protein
MSGRNFIEVWRDDDSNGLVNILCGHCDRIVQAGRECGWLCCQFATDMWRKYLEGQLVRR